MQLALELPAGASFRRDVALQIRPLTTGDNPASPAPPASGGAAAAGAAPTAAACELRVSVSGEEVLVGNLVHPIKHAASEWYVDDSVAGLTASLDGGRFLVVEMPKATTRVEWPSLLLPTDGRPPPAPTTDGVRITPPSSGSASAPKAATLPAEGAAGTKPSATIQPGAAASSNSTQPLAGGAGGVKVNIRVRKKASF